MSGKDTNKQIINIDGDENVVSQQSNQGLSYADAKEIALDIFNKNIIAFSASAREIVDKRINEFVNKLIIDLEHRTPDIINAFESPGIQFSLFNAQRDYARTGDPQVGELLIDLIIEKACQEKRNFDDIVIDESLQVVPRLNEIHMGMLALLYICTVPISGFSSFVDLVDFYRQTYPTISDHLFEDKSKAAELDFTGHLQHLIYTGCAYLGGMGSDWIFSLHLNYELLFQKPIDENLKNLMAIKDVASRLKAFLVGHPEEKGKYAWRTVSLQKLTNALKSVFYDHEIAIIVSFIKENSMDLEEKTAYLYKYDVCVKMQNAFRIIHGNAPRLTSVGISIGQSFLRKMAGVDISGIEAGKVSFKGLSYGK